MTTPPASTSRHRKADAMSEPPVQPDSPDTDPNVGPAPVARGRHHRLEMVIWGAHGGAGTTTLATWLQPARDAGAMSPAVDPVLPAVMTAGRVLVVACRCTAWSAAQADDAVAAVTDQDGQVAVVAVVSDGRPEPHLATVRFQLLAARVGAVVRVPFVAGLRLADDPGTVPLPRPVLRALAQIQAAAGRPSPLR
jgi:hypothetical protein